MGRYTLVAALEQWCWKLVIGKDVIDETFGHRLFIVKNNPLWHRAVMLRYSVDIVDVALEILQIRNV